MQSLTLYSMPSSGNSYKARLLLSYLGLGYRHVGMEYLTPELDAAHRDGALPFGKLPVLVIPDGARIPESNAILCYLAEGTKWLPEDRVTRAHVLGWLFWEQNQHESVIAVRAALRTYPHRRALATPDRMAELLERGQSLLGTMEQRLAHADWLVGDTATIADLSLYAYTHSAEEKGGFDLAPYPGLRRWLDRVASLPGHVPLDHLPA